MKPIYRIARELTCVYNNIRILTDTLSDINPMDEETIRRYQAYIDELKTRRDAIGWTLEELGYNVDIKETERDIVASVQAPSAYVVAVKAQKVRKARAA